MATGCVLYYEVHAQSHHRGHELLLLQFQKFGVNTEEAKCGMQSDEAMIKAHVMAQGGFAQLDATVNSLRFRSLSRSYRQMIMGITWAWALLLALCLLIITLWSCLVMSDVFAVREDVDVDMWD